MRLSPRYYLSRIITATVLLSLFFNVQYLRFFSNGETHHWHGILRPTEQFTRRTTTATTSFAVKYNLSKSSIWWTNYTYNLSRVYQPTQDFSWCVPEKSPTHEWNLPQEGALGLIYIKTYKASSSTNEGISLSIAHNVARRMGSKNRPCIHYNRHVFQDVGGLQYRARPSLVWTMIRHPIERDLSSYYFFEVSRKINVTVTDAHLVNRLRGYKNFQTNYLLPWDDKNPWTGSDLMKGDDQHRAQVLQLMHQNIMDNYDLIGITERMDESLAVMVLLWQLEATDVIVLSAKQAGGYDDAGHTGRCSKIVRPQPPSPVLQDYWTNEHARDNADFLLWDAANLSLDRTIQTLGRERVEKVVKEIRGLRNLADYFCQGKAYFPCSSNGEKQLRLAEQSCYVQDAGCGYKCVDKTMDRYRRGELTLSSQEERIHI